MTTTPESILTELRTLLHPHALGDSPVRKAIAYIESTASLVADRDAARAELAVIEKAARDWQKRANDERDEALRIRRTINGNCDAAMRCDVRAGVLDQCAAACLAALEAKEKGGPSK